MSRSTADNVLVHQDIPGWEPTSDARLDIALASPLGNLTPDHKSIFENEIANDRLEVASVALSDVPSLCSGSTASSTDPTERVVEAVNEFVERLFTDKILRPLYTAALERVDPEKFQRNFSRLLIRYATDLRKEISDPLHVDAVKMVRRYAQYVASGLRKKLDSNEGEKYRQMNELLITGRSYHFY